MDPDEQAAAMAKLERQRPDVHAMFVKFLAGIESAEGIVHYLHRRYSTLKEQVGAGDRRRA